MRKIRTQRRYSPEFKANAVQLVETSEESIRAIAERLGVNQWTLRDWYRGDVSKRRKTKATEKARTENLTAEEKLAKLERENARLRKQVEGLEMDRAILKKAAAFFAKESE